MAKYATAYNRTFTNGVLVEESAPYQIDITPQWVADNLRTKGLAALTANQTFLAKVTLANTDRDSQLRLLTREVSALIRLILGGGLKHIPETPALLDDTATDT